MSPQELTETFKSMSDGLYRVAFYILESQSDAQDVVQDLFIKLWNTRDELDKVLNLKAYCTTLIKNLCIDRIRKASKEQSIGIETDIPESRTVDGDLIAKDKLDRVMAAIEGLPKGQRNVVKMYVLDGILKKDTKIRVLQNKLH